MCTLKEKQNKKQKPPGSDRAHETVHQGQSLMVECRDAESFKCAILHVKVSIEMSFETWDRDIWTDADEVENFDNPISFEIW